ncbi:MAG: hypothetical protein D6739_00300 [Nitrospirae bacterium]|nr:MAG: hypothetical protein D6739_00300 [Nitrospirota bacterium]
MADPPRTSETDPIEVAWLPPALPGRIGLTLAPGKRATSALSPRPWRRDLGADLDRLAEVHGVTTLVCLMEDHELAACAIERLPEAARERGIDLLRLPIPDGGVPEDPEATRALVAEIVRRARAGGRVVIHCRGGLGRSGTIAGAVLRSLGWGAEETLAALRAARGPSCPETAGQRSYVAAYRPDGAEGAGG